MEKESEQDLTAAQKDISVALDRWFGTPDQPKWPTAISQDPALAKIVDEANLTFAAGQVRSDQEDRHYGLYREHCAHCHGITGNGAGPTSIFLSPYPRDFRMGIFKFKSTPRGKKPTRADLDRVLHDGLQGTSMPSFATVEEHERQILADYVRYLSIRGEVERGLINYAVYQLDLENGERLFDADLESKDKDAFESQCKAIDKIVVDIASKWVEEVDPAANASIALVPPVPADLPIYPKGSDSQAPEHAALVASIERGSKVYLGQVANCANCHGKTGMGDGQVQDYDDWTKDWSVRAGIDPKDKNAIRPFLAAGAMKPHTISPRNLRSGVLRGGSKPEDLYRRIVHGIDGSPMPAAPMKPENPQGLTPEDVWDLVNFLLALPHAEST